MHFLLTSSASFLYLHVNVVWYLTCLWNGGMYYKHNVHFFTPFSIPLEVKKEGIWFYTFTENGSCIHAPRPEKGGDKKTKKGQDISTYWLQHNWDAVREVHPSSHKYHFLASVSRLQNHKICKRKSLISPLISEITMSLWVSPVGMNEVLSYLVSYLNSNFLD